MSDKSTKLNDHNDTHCVRHRHALALNGGGEETKDGNVIKYAKRSNKTHITTIKTHITPIKQETIIKPSPLTTMDI